jgi:hypothetical protein
MNNIPIHHESSLNQFHFKISAQLDNSNNIIKMGILEKLKIYRVEFFGIDKLWLTFFGLYPSINLFNLRLFVGWAGTLVCIIAQINFFVQHSNDIKRISEMLPEFSSTIMTLVKITLFVYHRKAFKSLYEKLEYEWKLCKIY